MKFDPDEPRTWGVDPGVNLAIWIVALVVAAGALVLSGGCGAASQAQQDAPDAQAPREGGVAQLAQDGAAVDGVPAVAPDAGSDLPGDTTRQPDAQQADAWVDPLGPTPSTICPGSDAWRIPKGTCLWVWGRYTMGITLVDQQGQRMAACLPENRGGCSTISHVRQCDTVGFKGDCIDGDLIATIGQFEKTTPASTYRVERHPVINGVCSKTCPP